MVSDNTGMSIVMLCIIVNDGLGSKACAVAKACGAHGATVYLARGTAPSRVLKFLGLEESKKEVLSTVVKENTVDTIIERLERELELSRPGNGIAFAVPVHTVFGSHLDNIKRVGRGEGMADHDLIYTVVDRGFAEDVVEATRRAGAKGGTIIKGRGTGIHETESFFGVAIEPEKEIVMTLVPKAITESVIESINKSLALDTPGRGMAFVMDVSRTVGISHGVKADAKNGNGGARA